MTSEEQSMQGPDDRVLHHLVVRGLVPQEALPGACELDDATVASSLAELAAAGLVVERTGRVAGWSPTAEGREAHAALLATDALRQRAGALQEWYGRFEAVNASIKQLFARWQLRDGPDGPVPNDHQDPAYDQAVVDELAVLHGEVVDLLAEVGVDRIDRYAARAEAALEAVQAGEHERLAAPLRDSYHDVWMELHQDLLLSLDRRRTAADA